MQMQPDVQPLATIEYQGVVWPVAWTSTFGKGRVFHTSARPPRLRARQRRPAPRSESQQAGHSGVEWVAPGHAPPKQAGNRPTEPIDDLPWIEVSGSRTPKSASVPSIRVIIPFLIQFVTFSIVKISISHQERYDDDR